MVGITSLIYVEYVWTDVYSALWLSQGGRAAQRFLHLRGFVLNTFQGCDFLWDGTPVQHFIRLKDLEKSFSTWPAVRNLAAELTNVLARKASRAFR